MSNPDNRCANEYAKQSPDPPGPPISVVTQSTSPVLQLCSLGCRVPSRPLCGSASAVVEALIRIGYGLIRNKSRNGSQMNRKAETRRETPTFSGWEAGVKETRWLP